MRIRIKSCKDPHFWYRDRIGEEFDTYPEHQNNLGHCVHLGRVVNSFVDLEDAEPIPQPLKEDFYDTMEKQPKKTIKYGIQKDNQRNTDIRDSKEQD